MNQVFESTNISILHQDGNKIPIDPAGSESRCGGWVHQQSSENVTARNMDKKGSCTGLHNSLVGVMAGWTPMHEVLCSVNVQCAPNSIKPLRLGQSWNFTWPQYSTGTLEHILPGSPGRGPLSVTPWLGSENSIWNHLLIYCPSWTLWQASTTGHLFC